MNNSGRPLIGFRIAVGAALALLSLAADAQDPPAWPSRTVRLVVPSSPGGGTDAYARLLAQGLAERLKQPFIVDNRPGASGNIGAEIAAKAAPDGCGITDLLLLVDFDVRLLPDLAVLVDFRLLKGREF